ncbi:MAG: peptide-methionine (R)-S-oxide reductase, partial [Oricola sp.]|nr:peptide-methionine (R)-S-oxide reductase [Oricola sp.]
MAKDDPDPKSIPDYDKWQLSSEEWKERLSPEAYAVLRKEATERAGTSPLNAEKRDGIFACAGCGFDLFKSETKFESGTGWPSFWDFIPGALGTKTDFKLIVPR